MICSHIDVVLFNACAGVAKLFNATVIGWVSEPEYPEQEIVPDCSELDRRHHDDRCWDQYNKILKKMVKRLPAPSSFARSIHRESEYKVTEEQRRKRHAVDNVHKYQTNGGVCQAILRNAVYFIGNSTTWNGMKQPNSNKLKNRFEPRNCHLVTT